jgi:hypothetical protein
MKLRNGLIFFPALVLVLAACSSRTIQAVELTNTTIPEPANQATADAQCEQDVAYYDGIVVIAQYYTLFEQGLYEEAFQLLSSSRPHANSLDEFIKNSEMLKIRKTKILHIQPLCEPISQLQTWTTPDPINRRMFYARIYAEGESGWVGSVPNGVHTYFITTVLENGEWKIYSVGTAPLP